MVAESEGSQLQMEQVQRTGSRGGRPSISRGLIDERRGYETWVRGSVRGFPPRQGCREKGGIRRVGPLGPAPPPSVQPCI